MSKKQVKKLYPVFEHEGEKYKKCRNCEVTRNITEYQRNGYSRTGTITYKSQCSFCFNLIRRNNNIIKGESYYRKLETMRRYYEKNKQHWADYKKERYKKKKQNNIIT